MFNALLSHFRLHNPDLVFLLEMKLLLPKSRALSKGLGFDDFFAVDRFG